nr:hypothetical protein [Tanacetum cinerariifolium]
YSSIHRGMHSEHAAAPILPLPISSPPLPLPSPLTTSPTNTGAPLGYKAVRIRMRALLSFTSHRTDVPEAEMPPQKRAYFTIPAPRLEIGESLAADVVRQPGPTLKADLRHDRVEGMVPSEDEAPIEDQPLSADASPTALLPEYMADSDPNEDPDEDPKEDHAEYPVDGGDGDDELSDDDDDDDDTDDEDEEP